MLDQPETVTAEEAEPEFDIELAQAPEEPAVDVEAADAQALSGTSVGRWLLNERKRRRQYLLVTAGVLLLCSAGTAVAYFATGPEPMPEVVVELGAPFKLYNLPVVVTDLKPTRSRTPHVRLKGVVELPETDIPALQANEARIIDAIAAYLRDRQRGDLSGQLGTDRLRAEIRTIVNENGGGGRVRDVLFEELIVD